MKISLKNKSIDSINISNILHNNDIWCESGDAKITRFEFTISITQILFK